MITFNKKAAKEHYLDILASASLDNVHNLKWKKNSTNQQTTKKIQKNKKNKMLIFMCNSYIQF